MVDSVSYWLDRSIEFADRRHNSRIVRFTQSSPGSVGPCGPRGPDREDPLHNCGMPCKACLPGPACGALRRGPKSGAQGSKLIVLIDFQFAGPCIDQFIMS